MQEALARVARWAPKPLAARMRDEQLRPLQALGARLEVAGLRRCAKRH
jgi:hypothetical protein